MNNGTITWSTQELEETYNKIGKYVSELASIVNRINTSNKNLMPVWVTNHSRKYYQEMEKVNAYASQLISQYESFSSVLGTHISALKSLDE